MVLRNFPYEIMAFKINRFLPNSRQLIDITVVPANIIASVVSDVGSQYVLIYKGTILLPKFIVGF